MGKVLSFMTAFFFIVMAFFAVPSKIALAATASLTNNTPGDVDQNTIARAVTVTTAEIPAGEIVTDVNITIDFHKINGSDCAAPGTEFSFSPEIGFQLTSPAGTTVALVYNYLARLGVPTYTNDTNAPRVVVTLDDSATATVGTTNAGLPESGTFRPEQALSAFNNQNPQGAWTLRIIDDLGGDVLCFYSFTLQLTTVPGIAPTITSAASASVAANDAFSHTFTATGNPAPTLSYSAENLPTGITLSGNTLSGTPTTPGDYSITATASNGIGSAAVQVFQLTVTGTAPTITSAASASVAFGDAFSHTFTATGNPAPTLSYSAENLPTGITLSGNTLSGTPTALGDYSITVTASNGALPNAEQVFQITVTGTAPSITSAASGSVAFGDAFSHTFTATGNPAPTFTYSDENLPTGITLSGNTLSGAPTALGDYSITATASNGVTPNAVQVFEITVTGTAPSITSAASATVAFGDAFSHTFTATGNPAPTFTYSAENLPTGVTLSGDTLSGTPTALGSYSITATASNGVTPNAVQVFEITVTGTAPSITSAAAASVAFGDAFSHTFTATGNPAPSFTYSDDSLPPGITRTGDTLSGTPTALGSYSITATASNGVTPNAVQVFEITVTGDAPVITSVAAGYVEQHAPFSHTFTAVGNPTPTLTYSDENLPPGITRTGDTLSGTPTHDGQFSVTVTASNGVAPDAVQVFILTVGELHVPPPAPNARDINFDDEAVAHASVPDALADSINIRVLYQNGAPTSWMGGSLYNGGSIGVEGIFDLGVQTAIDIFSPNGLTYFNGGAVFCVKGSGYLIWLAGSGSPRVPVIIDSYTVPEFPGFTCATLFEPGTLVLVSQNPVR